MAIIKVKLDNDCPETNFENLSKQLLVLFNTARRKIMFLGTQKKKKEKKRLCFLSLWVNCLVFRHKHLWLRLTKQVVSIVNSVGYFYRGGEGGGTSGCWRGKHRSNKPCAWETPCDRSVWFSVACSQLRESFPKLERLFICLHAWYWEVKTETLKLKAKKCLVIGNTDSRCSLLDAFCVHTWHWYILFLRWRVSVCIRNAGMYKKVCECVRTYKRVCMCVHVCTLHTYVCRNM